MASLEDGLIPWLTEQVDKHPKIAMGVAISALMMLLTTLFGEGSFLTHIITSLITGAVVPPLKDLVTGLMQDFFKTPEQKEADKAKAETERQAAEAKAREVTEAKQRAANTDVAKQQKPPESMSQQDELMKKLLGEMEAVKEQLNELQKRVAVQLQPVAVTTPPLPTTGPQAPPQGPPGPP